MKFIAEIDVMPHAELLDPQGKAVVLGLKNVGINEIENVRLGKHITLEVIAENETKAKELVEKASSKLLANPIMETFTYKLTPAE